MADAPATIPSPADTARAAIQKRADDATAQFEQLKADYRNSPAYKAEQLRAQLEQLDLDPSFLGKRFPAAMERPRTARHCVNNCGWLKRRPRRK